MGDQQGPTAQGNLLNGMWRPGWEGSLGENGYTCMAESLHCSPETITALLVNQQYPNTKLKVLHKKIQETGLRKGQAGMGGHQPTGPRIAPGGIESKVSVSSEKPAQNRGLCSFYLYVELKKAEFPGGPVVWTPLACNTRGMFSIPVWGTKISQAAECKQCALKKITHTHIYSKPTPTPQLCLFSQSIYQHHTHCVCLLPQCQHHGIFFLFFGTCYEVSPGPYNSAWHVLNI